MSSKDVTKANASNEPNQAEEVKENKEEKVESKKSTTKNMKDVKDAGTVPNEEGYKKKVSSKNIPNNENQSQYIAELEKKLKDAEDKIATHSLHLERKDIEIQNKEKALQTLSNTNKKLITSLEVMKKEVDEKLEKISTKALHEKMKRGNETQSPLEIVVKIKENELKNAHAMNMILKNDIRKKEQSEKLDYYHMYTEATNKIKFEEKKNQDLKDEIKLLNRNGEDLKRALEKIKDFDKERKNYRDEILKLKEKTKELQKTLSEEESKYNAMSTKLNNKIFEEEGKVAAIMKRRSLTPKGKANTEKAEKEGNSNVVRENKSSKKNMRSVKESFIYSRNKGISDEEKKLFSEEQLKKLEEVIDKSEIEKLEKKYETQLLTRITLENKVKSESKHATKTIAEHEEQLEFVNLQLKESEQKNKINIHQINELKHENKNLIKKLAETKETLEGITKILREKEQENNIILNQLNTLKKISKHNILAPLETTYSKKDKSKLSEFNDSNFSPVRKALDNSDMGNEHDSKNLRLSMNNTQENEQDTTKMQDDERYNLKPQKNKGLDDN